jgi:hypothetical protein
MTDHPPSRSPMRPLGATDGMGMLAAQAGSAVLTARGRRGVKLYSLPREQTAAVAACVIFIGMPSAVFLSLMPLWENFGQLPLVADFLSLTAPAVASLDFAFRPGTMPEWPLKRFFVAITSMVEFLFLVNFLMLSSRKVRKRAIMVWICLDHERLLRIALISGAILAAIWWLLFYNWTVIDFLTARGGQSGSRISVYAVFALPLDALVFGHVAAIIVAGSLWSLQKEARRLRRGKHPQTAPDEL